MHMKCVSETPRGHPSVSKLERHCKAAATTCPCQQKGAEGLSLLFVEKFLVHQEAGWEAFQISQKVSLH